MMNTVGRSIRNTHQNYSGRPAWRPNLNRPRHFQQWNHTSNPGFNQSSNEEFWCETCDRGFPRKDILEKHKQQHQKCNIDGCQFIAHPKVITNHIQMQHSTGLFKKIAVLNNPEDIKKWIEERKKKYPTKENVEKKAAETKEKINRGEKMGMKYKKTFEDKNKSDNMKRKYPFNNNHKAKQIKKNNFHENKPRLRKVDNIIPSTADNKKLKPFAGIQSLLLDDEADTEKVNGKNNYSECNNYFIEDIDNIGDHLITTDTNPTICGALSSLICNYGSSDEEECLEKSTTLDTPINISLKESNEKNKSKQNNTVGENTNQSEDGDSGPEEVKAIISNAKEDTDHAPPISVIDKKTRTSELKNNKKVIPNRRPRSKLPSTLLQKLLHNEIRQERNNVLQCIRHIVKHNYFDKK